MQDEDRQGHSIPGSSEGELAGVLHRNIHTLVSLREESRKTRGVQEVVADTITRFTGSMPFVYLHALLFGGWIVVNLGLFPGIEPFDPFPFVMLAMAASVEAIFLSTFVLISQNRMTAAAERRAELDVQISLLTEHELTQVIDLIERIGHRLGVQPRDSEHIDELKRDVHPEAVLKEIDRVEQEVTGTPPSTPP